MNRVSIIAPCYNEENNIKEFYEKVKDVTNKAKYDFELVFIDDGSTDDTLKEINKILSDKDLSIKVVEFSRNFGKEAAMLAGLENCTGDYAMIIDTDMQQDPRLIIKALNILEDNKEYDSVVFYQGKRNESIIKKILKKSFYKLINRVSDVNFVSGASDFRLINRNMINAIVSMKEKTRFSKGIFSFVGFKQYYASYKVSKRFSGKTKWSIRKLIKYAFDGIRAFSSFPLTIVNALSNILLLTSLVYLIIIACNNLIDTTRMLIFIVLLVGGIVVKSISIISKYLYLTYKEIQNRPIYIVKKIKNNGDISVK